MIELFVTMCLTATPDTCKDVTFNSYDENTLPIALMLSAQAEGAKWLERHPGWHVSRYGTRRAGLYGKA